MAPLMDNQRPLERTVERGRIESDREVGAKKLKAKHGSLFSPMQLRIWSEMVVGEIYSSLDEPPSTSMFAKAGNPSTWPRKESVYFLCSCPKCDRIY